MRSVRRPSTDEMLTLDFKLKQEKNTKSEDVTTKGDSYQGKSNAIPPSRGYQRVVADQLRSSSMWPRQTSDHRRTDLFED
jgi:hypothetical protein